MENTYSFEPPTKRLGHLLAGAAILVQAPRLVLTLLAADRLPVADQAEQFLLSLAAVGTAIAVTGGGIYIAHAALTAARWRLPLCLAWLTVLTASAGLVSPAIAAGLADQELHEIVSSPALRAAWAVLAALAHELTAAGCMLAAAASSTGNLGAEAAELKLYAERDAALERAELAQERVELAEQRAQRAEEAEQALNELWEAALEMGPALPSNPEPFACEWCGRSFKTKQARGGHQRSCPARSGETRPEQGES